MDIGDLLKIRNNQHYFSELLNAKTIVPFIGAGMSYEIYPLWRPFLESFSLIEKEKSELKTLLDNGLYEEAASYLLALSSQSFIDGVKSQFAPEKLNRVEFSRALQLLPEIFSGMVITTNLDVVLEKIWDYNQKSFKSVITPDCEDQFNTAISSDVSFLVKLHGTVQESTRYVLTKEQYDACYGIDSANKIDFTKTFPRDLKRAVESVTLLFIGSSLQTDRVLHVLKQIIGINQYIRHYAFLSLSDDGESVTLRERNLINNGIKPIWFPKDDFDSIYTFLKKIKDVKGINIGKKAIRTLPSVIQLFGRDEKVKETIKSIEISDKKAVLITAIDGMPAVGKTVLAIKLANEFSNEYEDAQLFIDCKGYTQEQKPLAEEQIVNSLLIDLGIPNDLIPHNFQNKISLWRKELNGKKIIVVLDNVRSSKQIRELIPVNATSLFLITSRNRLLDLDGLMPLSLDVLEEDGAVELLKHRSQIYDNDAILKEIAHKYGYLPLALNIIGRQIYGRDRFFISRLLVNKKALSYLDAVKDSFSMSYEGLTEEHKKLLQVIALTPGTSFTSKVCAVMLSINEETVDSGFDFLFDQRLIDESDGNRYKIHDLLREYSRVKFFESNNDVVKERYYKRLTDYYVTQISYCSKILYPNQFMYKIKGFKKIDSQFDKNSALNWFNKEINGIFACLDIAKKNKWYLSYWKLAIVLSAYMRRSANCNYAIDMYEYAISCIEIKMDKYKYTSALTELAMAKHQASDFKGAVRIFSKAEKLWREIEDESGLAYALENRGFSLERLGDYKKAFKVIEAAFNIHKQQKNIIGMAFAYNSRGAVFWRLKKYPDALKMFEEAIKLRLNLKKKDKLGLSGPINNLAFTYLQLDVPNKARDGFEESRKISEEYNDYHGQAVSVNNLGYTDIFCELYSDAIVQASIALKLAEEVSDKYQIARSYDVKGIAYCGLGLIDNAIHESQKAFGLFDELDVPEKDEVVERLSYLNVLKERQTNKKCLASNFQELKLNIIDTVCKLIESGNFGWIQRADSWYFNIPVLNATIENVSGINISSVYKKVLMSKQFLDSINKLNAKRTSFEAFYKQNEEGQTNMEYDWQFYVYDEQRKKYNQIKGLEK